MKGVKYRIVLFAIFLLLTVNIALANVVINEFMANPSGAEPDAEWIEIYNNGTVLINLSGYNITDEEDTFLLPNITISPGAFLILVYNQTAFNQTYTGLPSIEYGIAAGGIGLSNGGESILVYNVSGLVDNITYGAAAADVSQGRYPDGQSQGSAFTIATPGNMNDIAGPMMNVWIIPAANNTAAKGILNISVNLTDAIYSVNASLVDFNGTNLSMSPNGYIWFYTWSTARADDGLHNITIFANDTIGYSSSYTLFNTTIDNTPPNVIGFNWPIAGANLSGVQLINATVNDTTLIVDTVLFNLSNTSGQVDVLNTTQSGDYWTATPDTSTYADGAYTLTIRANDTLNNINDSVSISIVLDNTNPLVTILVPINGTTLNRNRTLNATVTDATSGVAAVLFRVRNSSSTTTYVANLAGQWVNTSFDTTAFADGYYNISVAATDFAGNANSTEQVTVLIDNTPPVIAGMAKTPVPSYQNESVVLNATVTDALSSLDTVFIEGNWTGAFVNYTAGITNLTSLYSYLLGDGNLSNQENVGWRYYANDSIGNLARGALQTFMVANRVPIFTGLIPNITLKENLNEPNKINLSFYFTEIEGEDLNFSSTPLVNVTITIDNNTGMVGFLPGAVSAGNQSIFFFATDGIDTTASNNVSVTILPGGNQAPVALGTIPVINFSEDTNYTFSIAPFFTDPDGDPLTYNILPGFDNNLTVTVGNNSGQVNITPAQDYFGFLLNELTFRAEDPSGLAAVSTASVNVTPVNDAPFVSIPDVNLTEDTLIVNPVLNLSNFTSDVDNPLSDWNFTLEIQTNATLINCFISGQDLLFCNNPTANESGVSVLTLRVDDGNLSTTDSFSIRVLEVNDAPVINSTPVTTATQGTFYQYDVDAFDVEGDTLLFSLATSPSNMQIDNITGLILWLPTNADVGLASVTVLVEDGNGGNDTQAFTITVANINDPPVLDPIGMQNLSAGRPYTYDVNATDPDVGDTLTFSDNTTLFAINPATGVISFTPATVDIGLHSVNISVTDAAGAVDSEIVLFVISVLNSAPINSATIPGQTWNEDTANNNAFDLDNYFTDADGDPMTYTATGNSTIIVTIDGSNVVSFSQPADFNGSENVVFIASDGINTTPSNTVTLTVTGSPDAPVINTFTPTTLTPRIGIGNAQTFTITKTDPDGTIPTVQWYVDGVAQAGQTADSFIYSATQLGTFIIRADVSDGTSTVSQSWTLTVASNPVITAITGNTSIQVGEQRTLTITNTAPDNGTTAYSDNVGFGNLNKVSDTQATFSWTPTSLYIGTNTVTITAADSDSSDSMSVTLTVLTPTSNQTGLTVDDIEVEVDGDKISGIDEDGGDIDDDVFPGSAVDIKIELKNELNMDIENIDIEGFLEDIDDDDDLEDDDEISRIKPGDTKTADLTFKIPLEVEEGDYDLVVEIDGEDDDGVRHELEIDFTVEVEKRKHEIIIKNADLASNTLTRTRQTSLDVTVLNLGEDDEDEVRVTIENTDLGISLERRNIELETDPNDDNKFRDTFQLKIPYDAKPGTYPIEVSVYYDDTNMEDTETLDLTVRTPPSAPVVITPRTEQPETVTPVKKSFKDSFEYLLLLIVSFVVLSALAMFSIVALAVKLKKR